MKGTHLDQLTKFFFEKNHPGFDQTVSLSENILSTNVPIVELDLNIDLIPILNEMMNIDISRHTVVRACYPYDDYPRYQGWIIKELWHEKEVPDTLTDLYYKKCTSKLLPHFISKDKNQFKNTISILSTLGVDIHTCLLSVFTPGGYVRPHRDISEITTPLRYFWLPLNNPTGSDFRVFPKGPVNIKLGSLYLLNQENFVHAVYNNSDENRYNLIGWFDSEIEENFSNLIKRSIIDQYGSLIQ
jgi:hypothetical protein